VGRQLRTARKSKKLSQSELGRMLIDKSFSKLIHNLNAPISSDQLAAKKKTHQQLISQYEKGAVRIPCENLYLLSVILEVNTDYFFSLYKKLSLINKDLKSMDLLDIDMTACLIN
jgi:transcriptional regulator with XRE-family HTH domain